MTRGALTVIQADVVDCRACPRLVDWREEVAREKVARFADQEYWGRPVPGFGDPEARVLILGLAPAAHGGNRTGRIFTGDRSGDFLYRVASSDGLREPTDVGRAGRRSAPHRRLRERGEPMRAARQQAAARGARSVPAVPGTRDRRARGARGHRRAGGIRVGRRAASARRPRTSRPTEAAVRSRRGGERRTLRAGRVASTPASRTPSPASSRLRCSTTSCVGRARSRVLRALRDVEPLSRRESARAAVSVVARILCPWVVTVGCGLRR